MPTEHGDTCNCFDCDIWFDRCIDDKKAGAVLGFSQSSMQKRRNQEPLPEVTGTRAVRYRARRVKQVCDERGSQQQGPGAQYTNDGSMVGELNRIVLVSTSSKRRKSAARDAEDEGLGSWPPGSRRLLKELAMSMGESPSQMPNDMKGIKTGWLSRAEILDEFNVGLELEDDDDDDAN